MTCDWLESICPGLHLLKPKYRVEERWRSLVFFQTTWITICWKVIMEFLPNDWNKRSLAIQMLESSEASHLIIKLQSQHKWKKLLFVVMPSMRGCSIRQTVDELWKEAGLRSRGGASHDQLKCVCVFVCVLQSLATLCESIQKLCSFLIQATPTATATPPFARLAKELISCPLAHDQPFH